MKLNEFPQVKGILRENVSLSEKTFLGVGGRAEFLFEPADMDDLVFFLKEIPETIKVTPLGSMSNVLIRSKGIDGIVIILGDWFKNIFIEDNILEVGAAVLCSKVSTFAMDHELGGMEFLMGIPGTIGGAIKMNAGCFGSEIVNILVECEGILSDGNVKWFKKDDIGASYRHTSIPDNCIITRAWFKSTPGVNYSIPKRVKEIIEQRKSSQPIGVRTCGSTFKNPDGFKAWQLIEQAGCRGMKLGGAQVSEKHCNFIINTGNATAEDVEILGEQVVQKVFDKTGVKLEWEVIKLGNSN